MTIYNRFDAADNIERIDFRADQVLQSAELNELQSMQRHRLKTVSDAIFKDGDVIRDAGIRVNAVTGACELDAGAIYIQGAMRGVGPASLVVPTVGTVAVGIYLQERIVTELDDPDLLNPAVGTRGYGEPGAVRAVIDTLWGVAGDGTLGTFSPVYYIDDGILRLKEPPPNLDAVSQALARYDRDSTGGAYVVNGLEVAFLSTDASDRQIYTIAEGRAYVEGFPVTFQTARRVSYEALPETVAITSEPHLATTSDAQRVDVNHPAIASIQTIQITNLKTVEMTHGPYAGAADMLPDPSVIEIVSVTQGATVYHSPADFTLGAGSIDWAPGGAEPATGSTYEVTYKWIKTVAPESPDLTGFEVSGAVPGTLILVTYLAKLPRYDRLCLAAGGQVQWIKGVPSLSRPVPPAVPSTLLPLATVLQTWLDATRTVTADGPRTVSMAELSQINGRLDELYRRVAEHRLLSDVSVRDQGIQRGIFVDPFLDDLQRDAGIAQSAAIVAGELVLAVPSTPLAVSADVAVPTRCARNLAVDVNQYQRTGSMKINPYGSQIPPPVAVSISPAIDRWTEASTIWASPVTQRLTSNPDFEGKPYYWRVPGEVAINSTKSLGTSTQTIWSLRQIPVTVTATGFAPGEVLSRLTFDGIDVTPGVRPAASGTGVMTVGFVIPPNVPAGSKRVIVIGASGSYGEASFYGEGTRQVTSMQQVTTISPNYVLSFTDPNKGVEQAYADEAASGGGTSANILEWITKQRIAEINGGTCVIDPLAQTFRATRRCQLSAVQLTMTRMGVKPILVQVRTTTNGFPSGNILAEARLTPAGAVPQTVQFDFPVPAELYPNVEYALVVMTDDQVHEVGISELGKFDAVSNRWVTSQPYDIGTLLSSSNAQTWTAHQDKDLNFLTFRANYTEVQKVVNLGHVTVADATDLLLLGNGVSLSAAATVSYTLTMPDGRTMAAADGQRISLTAPVSGNIGVEARIRADADLSGILYPGTMIVAGAVAAEGDYVSRAIPCDAGDRLTVIYDAVIPAGATVAAYYQMDGAGPWVPVTAPTGRPADYGAVEFTSVTAGLPAGSVRVKIRITGTAAARPKVRNLRAMTTE